MNPTSFDIKIIHFLNQYATTHSRLNDFVILLTDNSLLKGGVLCCICWFLWFRGAGDRLLKNRKGIMDTLIFLFPALFITRVMVHLSTFRPRPFLNTDLGLFIPKNLNTLAFTHDNSFPSDHATMIMALSYGIFKTNRKFGWMAMIYSIIVILLPRIYLGLHYPTDILVGALVGMIAVETGFRLFHRGNKINQFILGIEKNKPQYFYPILFVITFQIADLFEDSRNIFGFIVHGK